jgi:signal peptidase II
MITKKQAEFGFTGYAAILIGLLLFLVDRVTKYMAVRSCVERVLVNQHIAFELVFNRGVSWSMLKSSSAFYFGLLTLFIISLTLFVVWDAWQMARAGKTIVGHVLVVAGSTSNIIDRLIYGGVIDFIECSYGSWCWPTFNFADMYIVLGILCMLWCSAEQKDKADLAHKTGFSQK